jgi:hypothetical protein
MAASPLTQARGSFVREAAALLPVARWMWSSVGAPKSAAPAWSSGVNLKSWMINSSSFLLCFVFAHKPLVASEILTVLTPLLRARFL